MGGDGRRGGAAAADTEWISRAIVGFGRYPNKRPSGLHVDSSGSFGLQELMKTWGKREGVTEEDVLGAVRKNMFHEGEAGALRFALGENEDGSIWIRVLPKRGQQQRACATPSRAQWQKQGNQWQQHGGSRGAAASSRGGGKGKPVAAPKLTPGPGLRGSVGLAPRADEKPAEAKLEGSLQERLEMALDEMIAGKKEKAAPPPAPSSASAMATKDKLQTSLDDVIRSEDVEMTDARDNGKQARSPNDKSAGWGKRSGGKDGGSNWDSWGWKASDKWSRRGGGRSGRGQQSWGWRDKGQWCNKEGASDDGADHRRGRSRSRSRGRSPASSSSASRSRSNSWRRDRGRRPRGRVEDTDAATDRGAKPSTKPPRPPGDFWTKYQDDGLVWWHYNGPLGQWFCSEDKGEPTPYNPDP